MCPPRGNPQSLLPKRWNLSRGRSAESAQSSYVARPHNPQVRVTAITAHRGGFGFSYAALEWNAREVSVASSYRGVYVQRYSNGQIHNVEVVAPGGSSHPISFFDYQAREIQPPVDRLPDADEYFAKLGNP